MGETGDADPKGGGPRYARCVAHEETREKPHGPDKLSFKGSNFLQNGTRFDENVENEEL